MMYLDYAAASPVDPTVLKAMEPWIGQQFGNPSSIHRAGQEARAAVDKARMTVADFLHCSPTEVFFTSSGTESCNWALLGSVEQRLLKGEQAHIIISAIEHSAVLETARFLERSYGIDVSLVPVDQHGFLDMKALEETFRKDTLLVSVMAVNNEIGSIQDLEQISALCQARDVLLHSDACQATAFCPLNMEALPIDLLSLNASKIGGPKGVGALFVREGTALSPWTFGGGQEFRMRAGTENVPAIVGFAEALTLMQAKAGEKERLQLLKEYLWEALQHEIKGCALNGSWEGSAAHILNIFIPGVDGESLVKRLDLEGYAVSTGSACTSGVVEPSHVILALGYDPSRARSSLRISLGAATTQAQLRSFVAALSDCVLDLST